jgi:hypothetical protein
MTHLYLEAFGTGASIVIAASLMMKNLKRLRLINLIGALLFALYGLGIGSLPVLVVNAFIAGIDGWYLFTSFRARSHFSLLHAGSEGGEYLRAFLSYYRSDIATYLPSFSEAEAAGAEAVFVLRDMIPASLVLYRHRDEGIDLLLDYSVPAFRDYKNAEFFFAAAARDIAKGRELKFFERSETRAHGNYLKRLGFVETTSASTRPGGGVEYVKTVGA